MRDRINNKRWFILTVGIVAISILTIVWRLDTSDGIIQFNLVTISIFSILLILLSGCLWLYDYLKTSNSLLNEEYIRKNFSKYRIEKELVSLGRNKLFLMRRGNDDYILKICRKGIRRAYIEAVIMRDLQEYLPMPYLYSYRIWSTTRYLLMPYCGLSLVCSDKEKHYYNFGKLIARIRDVPITNSIRNVIKQMPTKKFQQAVAGIDSNHPYVRYLQMYQEFQAIYFSHGDLTLSQAMLEGDNIKIIDWESACLNYSLFDLARALSDTLTRERSKRFAQEILAGYCSIVQVSSERDIKFLLGLIWFNLYKVRRGAIKNNASKKFIDNISFLLEGRDFEEALNMKKR